MRPSDDQAEPADPTEPSGATEPADDGMAPLISNTGADDGEGDDADAPSG